MAKNYLCALSLLMFFLPGSSALSAQTGSTDTGPVTDVARPDRRAEIARIVSALESKVESRWLPAKARAKLATLSDDRLDLIASLAKQMVDSRRTLARDVAFLLVTSLLILS